MLNDKSRLDEAKTYFLKAIEVAPDDPLAYWNLHAVSNDIATARAVLELCLSKDANNRMAICTLAGLHAFEGNRQHLDLLISDGFAGDPLIRSIEWLLSRPSMPQIRFNRWDVFDLA